MQDIRTYEEFVNEAKTQKFEKVVSVTVGSGTVKKVRHNPNSVNYHSEVYLSKGYVSPGSGNVEFTVASGATYSYNLDYKVMTQHGERVASDIKVGDSIAVYMGPAIY